MEESAKKEALFLPFMQIPTGHHHVADALMDELNKNMNCNKVDILSYSFGRAEGLVSSVYLHWIRFFPWGYNWLYSSLAFKKRLKRNRQFLYEALFIHFFKRLLQEYGPHILFFTHCLPSNIGGILKRKGLLNAITVNVYTDYFVNRVWGMKGIDYHLVPSLHVKEFLLQLGVREERIFVTGIPVHSAFRSSPVQVEKGKQLKVLVTGGSLGVGAIEKLLPENSVGTGLSYDVLCGKNETLYHQLRAKRDVNIKPIPYIRSKEKMNILYEQADAVITKPGGVTVSECLMKRKPIFISGALPGQEKVNLDQLKEMGLIMPLDLAGSVEQQILKFFTDKEMQTIYKVKLDNYHRMLVKKPIDEILNKIMNSKKH